MKTILSVILLVCATGCSFGPRNYYPGNVPENCHVIDGYCYHTVWVDGIKFIDVYVWTPRHGWLYHQREHVPLNTGR